MFLSLPPPKNKGAASGARVTIYTLAGGWLYALATGSVHLHVAVVGSLMLVTLAALTREW